MRCGSPFFLLLKLAFFLFNHDAFIVLLLPITLDLTLSPTVRVPPAILTLNSPLALLLLKLRLLKTLTLQKLLIAATSRVSSLKVVLLHILDEEIAHSFAIQVNILTLLKHFIKLGK